MLLSQYVAPCSLEFVYRDLSPVRRASPTPILQQRWLSISSDALTSEDKENVGPGHKLYDIIATMIVVLQTND